MAAPEYPERPGTGVPSQPVGLPQGMPGPLGDALPAEVLGGPPATIGRARAHRNRRRTGAWPAGGAPRVDPNSLESVADDVTYWLESTAQDVSRAMMDGAYAPFGARISAQDQARYYGETLFTPQGQLDPGQWQAEYQRLGPDGLAQAINGGARWRRQRGLPVSLPVSRFQETSVGPTPGGVVDTTPAGGWRRHTPLGQPGPGGRPPAPSRPQVE
jgi:hypothetical protein